jgi:hypothetical protein
MKQFYIRLFLLIALLSGIPFNSIPVDAQTNFYPRKPTSTYSNLAVVSSWITAPTGLGGTVCTSFTTASQIFHVTGTLTPTQTIAGNWAVSGAGSYIVIGSGSTTVNFTIPAAYQVTGSIDSINTNATLTIQNSASLSSVVWTATKAMPTSTVDFLSLGSSTTIPVSFTYGNVIFDGTKLANTASGTFGFEGNFTLQNAGAGFVPVQVAGGSGVSLNLLGSLNQTITGNGYEFHCFTFSDTNKTGGNVTFSANTPLNMFQHICLKQSGPTNVFSDGGNTDTVFNNINMDGVASAYNFTGTMVLNGTSGTQKISNSYGLADASAIVAPLNNLTINCSNTVSFLTNTSRQNITLKGNLDVIANNSPIDLVTTSPTTGVDTFFIGGNYTNSSATAVTFNNKTVYVLNGGTAQTLQTSIGGGETFTNLEIDNTSGTGVTLNSPFNVSGAFTLTNGLVNTTTTHILTLNTNATSSAGVINSYVNGPMAKIGNTAFEFPVGGGGWLAQLAMGAPSASATITAQFFLATPVNPTSVVAPITNVSVIEYWTLSESVASLISNIRLYWQSGPLSGIYNYSSPDLLVADYTGGAWNALNTSSTVSGVYPGAGYVTSASSIGSSEFTNLPITFASTDQSINPLPITLTSFNATYQEESNSVLLDWVVATQLNNRDFVIEKTIDGINYTEVATIEGAGTTPFTKSYSVVDNYPTPGVSYYRLKQIDMDGNTTEFSPVSVEIANFRNNTVSLFPNPINESAILSYEAENTNPVTLIISDISGKVVYSTIYNGIQKGENNFNLNLSFLHSGIYFLRIENGDKAYNVKMLKI